MKAFPTITALLLTTALVGCQVENDFVSEEPLSSEDRGGNGNTNGNGGGNNGNGNGGNKDKGTDTTTDPNTDTTTDPNTDTTTDPNTDTTTDPNTDTTTDPNTDTTTDPNTDITTDPNTDTTTDPNTDTTTDPNTDTTTDPNTDTTTDPEPTNTISTVTLYWSAPIERVNGDALAYTDIGGYEIRYKNSADQTYSNIVITDPSIEQYSIDNIENADSYQFEVAVFDADGIYSDFVLAMAN